MRPDAQQTQVLAHVGDVTQTIARCTHRPSRVCGSAQRSAQAASPPLSRTVNPSSSQCKWPHVAAREGRPTSRTTARGPTANPIDADPRADPRPVDPRGHPRRGLAGQTTRRFLRRFRLAGRPTRNSADPQYPSNREGTGHPAGNKRGYNGLQQDTQSRLPA